MERNSPATYAAEFRYGFGRFVEYPKINYTASCPEGLDDDKTIVVFQSVSRSVIGAVTRGLGQSLHHRPSSVG